MFEHARSVHPLVVVRDWFESTEKTVLRRKDRHGQILRPGTMPQEPSQNSVRGPVISVYRREFPWRLALRLGTSEHQQLPAHSLQLVYRWLSRRGYRTHALLGLALSLRPVQPADPHQGQMPGQDFGTRTRCRYIGRQETENLHAPAADPLTVAEGRSMRT